VAGEIVSLVAADVSPLILNLVGADLRRLLRSYPRQNPAAPNAFGAGVAEPCFWSSLELANAICIDNYFVDKLLTTTTYVLVGFRKHNL
jgi:hypothetical protein